MDIDEVDERLRLLDQALDTGDYRGARVRLFGLLHGLALATEQDDEPWRAAWVGPVQQRALPFYTLLVKQLRRDLRSCEHRAKVKRSTDSDQTALRQLMKRQREIVAQALYAHDADDRQLSIRELSRVARDSKALECLGEARQVLKEHLGALDRIDQRGLDLAHRKRQQEVARLRKQAREADRQRARAKTLQRQVHSSSERSRHLEERLEQKTASLDERERTLKRGREAEQRLAQEMQQERAERRRHEQRLSQLEQQASHQDREHRQALSEAQRRLSHADQEWSHEREGYEEEHGMLRQRLADRDQTIAGLQQRVSIREQDRHDRLELILALMHEEEELLKHGEMFTAHEEYGVLIAWIWQEIASRNGLEFHDLQLFEQELAALLDQPAQVELLLGHREAIIAFNEYQAVEVSPLEDLVEQAGYGAANRDLLILAFAEHWHQWCRDHQTRVRELFLRFQSGTLPGQDKLEAWFQARGIDPVVLTVQTFAACLGDHPAMVQGLIHEPPVQRVREPRLPEYEPTERPSEQRFHEVASPPEPEREESPFGV